jgi:two-component system response regulator PilR (NtrC family)
MDAAISISTDVAALSSDVARISMPRVAENAAGKLPEGLSVDGRSQSMVSSGNFNDVPASNTISMQQSGVLSLPGLPSLPCSLPDYLDTIERDMIRRALQQTRNNRTQAAELLGVSFRHLRYQIQKLQIQDPE